MRILLALGVALPSQGSKFEWGDYAIELSSGKVTVTTSDIPELLERLQDMNWPGSYLIARYLPRFGNDLIEPIRTVLRSKDNVWIYWVLGTFSNEFNEAFWTPLKFELEGLASTISLEETHVRAVYILARTGLMDTNEVRLRINELKAKRSIDDDDYDEIKALLTERG